MPWQNASTISGGISDSAIRRLAPEVRGHPREWHENGLSIGGQKALSQAAPRTRRSAALPRCSPHLIGMNGPQQQSAWQQPRYFDNHLIEDARHHEALAAHEAFVGFACDLFGRMGDEWGHL